MKVRITLAGILIGTFATVATRAADLDAGKRIYTSRCARCHPLRDPNKYDDKTWSKWMVKMQRKAKLTDMQEEQLLAYLQTLRTPQ